MQESSSTVEPKEAITSEVIPNVPEGVMMAGTVIEYLKTEKGHEVAKSIVAFFQEWKSQAIKINKHAIMWTSISQFATLALVLGVAVYVTVTGKMEPVIAGLLGTLAGYVLGRRAS